MANRLPRRRGRSADPPHLVVWPIALVGLVTALGFPQELAGTAMDRLTPATTQVDRRIVAVSFDERQDLNFGDTPIPHRQGVLLRDVVVEADRRGAAAVVLVGFDSLALLEGPADRQAVAESERIQRLGIVPLLDVGLESGPDRFPRADRYRVDDLSSHFAGIGLPVTSDSRTLRTVPAVATVRTVAPGAVVRGSERRDGAATALVFGLALRSLVPLGYGEPEARDADVVRFGDLAVPLEAGRLRVRWSRDLDDRADAPVVPARQVLERPGPAPDWSGAVVLVGTTDPAQARDFSTPVGTVPELLVHANALNTLLTTQFLRTAPPGLVPSVAMVLSLLIALLAATHWRAAVAFGLVAAAALVTAGRLLAGAGWLVDGVSPAVGALAAAVAVVGRRTAQQVRERRRLADLFAEYVPPDVARNLVATGRVERASAGERLDVTVLFCDLRGFTVTAEALTPGQVRELLDIYYEAYSRTVLEHDGTVLQYTGDEIFAVFGAPLPRDDHADAALHCAARMHHDLPEVNALLRAQDLPPIAFGIGLHSGEVIAAHVGSSVRRQYAVIGDTVNVGSRLCSQAAASQTVFSDALARRLAEPASDAEQEVVVLKGVSAPVTVFRRQHVTVR